MEATLTAFYRRVRPVGAWRYTAGDDAGRPRAALLRQMGEVGITALSLFTLPVGLGRLLVPPSGASFVVSPGFVALGIALVRALRREREGDDMTVEESVAETRL